MPQFEGTGHDINLLCDAGVNCPGAYSANLYDIKELQNFWQAFKPTLDATPNSTFVIGGIFATMLHRLNEVTPVNSPKQSTPAYLTNPAHTAALRQAGFTKHSEQELRARMSSWPAEQGAEQNTQALEAALFPLARRPEEKELTAATRGSAANETKSSKVPSPAGKPDDTDGSARGDQYAFTSGQPLGDDLLVEWRRRLNVPENMSFADFVFPEDDDEEDDDHEIR